MSAPHGQSEDPATQTASAAVELASTQRLSELALESGQLGSWSLNATTKETQRSLRHDQIFGYEELNPNWTYSTFLEHLDPLDRERVDAEYRNAIEPARIGSSRPAFTG